MTDLAKLSAAATPGEWTVDDVFMQDGNAVRLAMPDRYGIPSETIAEFFMTDADECSDRMIGVIEAESNAALCSALVNAYRTGSLIDPTDDAALAQAGLVRVETQA